MNHEELIKAIEEEKVPVSGTMYALYKDRVVYCPYCMTREAFTGDENQIILKEYSGLAENLLELHLFDTEREYRLVFRRGRKPVSKVIDDSCMEKEAGVLKYIEQIITLDMNHTGKTGLVNMVNYITYDEDDLLHIENYRLMEVR